MTIRTLNEAQRVAEDLEKFLETAGHSATGVGLCNCHWCEAYATAADCFWHLRQLVNSQPPGRKPAA